MYTGGEPLIRKADIITVAKENPDCLFLTFTNGTLVDDAFCEDMKACGNLALALSVEGSEETTDARRGAGSYRDTMAAMALLKKHGCLFGVSVCYTSQNCEAVTSDAFMTPLLRPVPAMPGTSTICRWAATQIRICCSPRSSGSMCTAPFKRSGTGKNGKPIFTVDFQNDAEFVGGCIAGGRNYFHINSEGDAEPCVFIHYSDSNIRQKSIKECLQSPLFYEYYKGQPFNNNMLRPCPMLENPAALRRIVSQTGAKSTNFLAPESAEALCAKCDAYAAAWAPTAKRIWEEKSRFRPFTQYYRDTPEGKTDGEVQKLQNLPLPTEK